MAMTLDNVSTNDELFRHAARALLTLYNIDEHPDRHIRCLAHIINLVVQAILAGLNEADDCNEDEGKDNYLQNKGEPIYYDVSKDPTQIELENQRSVDIEADPNVVDDFERVFGVGFSEIEEELKELGLTTALKKVMPCCSYFIGFALIDLSSCFHQLHFIATKIASSPQRRQRFWKISGETYGDRRVDETNSSSPLLRLLMVIRDVRTRWNSTHAMLSRALLLREVRLPLSDLTI